MKKRYSPNARIGVHEIDGIVTRSKKWIFREQPIEDVGIDAIIEYVNDNPTGKFIALQIKSGLSHFKESANYLTYYISKEHYDYWINLSLPVLIVGYIPELNITVWECVNKNTIKRTQQKGWKIEIPKSKLLLESIEKHNSEELLNSGNYLEIDENDDFSTIDKSASVFEQLNQFIETNYTELSFIPLQIIETSYPFYLKGKSFFYPISNYTLTTNNEELFDFFKKINIINNEIIFTDVKLNSSKLFIPKLKNILVKLSQNLITNIQSSKTHEAISISLFEKSVCNCYFCSFLEFRFSDTFDKLTNKEFADSEQFKLSYTYYQIGNYTKTHEILEKFHDSLKTKNFEISSFISAYNLNMLKSAIPHSIKIGNASVLNLKEILKKNLTKGNSKILNWIKDEKFYHNSRDKIQSQASKIREVYYNSMIGGYNPNPLINTLIIDYAELYYFISSNYIIYDKSKKFEDLSDVFFEALFASHGTVNPKSFKLSYFNDWIIDKIIRYANPDSILKYRARYKITYLNYKETDNSRPFKRIIENFFTKNIDIEEKCDSNNLHFWGFYNKVFNNLLLLSALCNFDEQYYNCLIEKVGSFLKNNKKIYPSNFKYIIDFLNLTNDKISSNRITTFFYQIFDTYENNYYLSDFTDFLEYRKIKISLTNFQFNKLINLCIENNRIKYHTEYLYAFYSIIKNKNQKNIIKRYIQNHLVNSFDFDIFYLATIYDIIKFNLVFFNKATEYCCKKENLDMYKDYPLNNRTPYIQELINIVYKYNISTIDKKFDEIKNFDNYYRWLLDIDDFDYSLFQTNWLNEYNTFYYTKQMRKSKPLKKYLENYLHKNYHDIITEKSYINIFVRKIK